LTTLNPHVAGTQFTTPHLISWTDPEGGTHRSIFLPPSGPVAAPYPTVFVVYEGRRSQCVSRFGIEHPQYDNMHVYAAHGYAVCVPDLVVSDAKPAASIRDMVSCAVNATVEAGLADPARLGIFGHSYGGYIVNVAITSLDCFAAAVSAAGPFNLTSEHGTARETYQGDGVETDDWWVESGQGRMGGPPWEQPQRYVENSPLFFLDRVTAPVLVIAGSQEMILAQSQELFSGLRRLDKTAVLAIYEGEDHGYDNWTRVNTIDRWNRVLAWFDKYLRVVE
jgi:dipeptidyl aminopeptidase/acylaminoacyl peptidase